MNQEENTDSDQDQQKADAGDLKHFSYMKAFPKQQCSSKQRNDAEDTEENADGNLNSKGGTKLVVQLA